VDPVCGNVYLWVSTFGSTALKMKLAFLVLAPPPFPHPFSPHLATGEIRLSKSSPVGGGMVPPSLTPHSPPTGHPSIPNYRSRRQKAGDGAFCRPPIVKTRTETFTTSHSIDSSTHRIPLVLQWIAHGSLSRKLVVPIRGCLQTIRPTHSRICERVHTLREFVRMSDGTTWLCTNAASAQHAP
jgi:hypothetical protein